MAKVGVSLKIDVSKIDKARLYKGQKGTYLDATVFVDINEEDQYGNNGMITQNVSKEGRESGTRGAILGNCKVFYRDGLEAQGPAYQGGGNQSPESGAFNDFDDSVPF